MTRVAVLGMGAMGSRMARNLLKMNHEVVVYSRTADHTRSLVEAGARRARSPREAAEAAEAVISSVTDDVASRALWLDADEGAALGLCPSAIAIESSTLSPLCARELGHAVAARRARFVDAPVLGSPLQADTGSLVYLVGGSENAYGCARPFLSASASTLHHVGPVGSGMTLKLAVSALSACQVAALAEMLQLVESAGIPRETTAALLDSLPVTSGALQGIALQLLGQPSLSMSRVDLVEKDLRYVVEAAGRLGVDMPSAAAAQPAYASACAFDGPMSKVSGVLPLLERVG